VPVTPWSFTTLRTARLTLRPPVAGDLDALHALQSDPEVVRYQLFEPRSRDDVARRLPELTAATVLEKADDFIQPAMELATNDGPVVIGTMYFVLKSVENATGEIGWSLRREYQGQGFAHEGAVALLEVAFDELGLHRVTAELDPRNDASVSLCTRLGMRREAHFVEDMMFKGDWADTGVYAILQREWRARQ
jgi:RimJ/RimL family protein N-acetyltransferase